MPRGRTDGGSPTANGELESKVNTITNDTWLYQYDVRGNLRRVDLPGGDIIEYLIDGKDRRVGKEYNGTLVSQWLWTDQLRIAAELDGSGNLVSRFVYGSKPTTPEFAIMGGNTYRVIADHLGSVRALVNINDASDVPVELDYDVFGEVTGVGVGFIPQGFAGGMYDADTELVRFGARDYDPVVGRWVAKDPIGWEGDGVNLYAYVMGDPISFSDPTGRASCDTKRALVIGFKVACYASCLAASGPGFFLCLAACLAGGAILDNELINCGCALDPR